MQGFFKTEMQINSGMTHDEAGGKQGKHSKNVHRLQREVLVGKLHGEQDNNCYLAGKVPSPAATGLAQLLQVPAWPEVRHA